MLRAVEASTSIQKAQRRFAKTLAGYMGEPGRQRPIGHQGGQLSCRTYTDGQRWFASTKFEHGYSSPRHWNAVGLDYKGTKRTEIITVEINVPLSGYNGRVAGAFANDETGNTYILHDGNIGGGRAGIGKSRFLDWVSADLVDVHYRNGSVRPFIPIGQLGSKQLPESVFWFAETVEEFKRLVIEEETHVSSNPAAPSSRVFNPEFSGKRRLVQQRSYAALCEHGKIVDALKECIGPLVKPRDKIVNSRAIDLGVENGRGWKAIFEVKTSADTQSIYTAFGQLMINSEIKNGIGKVMVMPGSMSEYGHLIDVFRRAGIRLVTFKKAGKSYRFEGIKPVALKLF